MEGASRRISTVLKSAIRREERTAASYTKKARQAKHPSAKKVLEVLAKQEAEHASKLMLILNKGLDFAHFARGTGAQVESLHVLNDDVRRIEKTSEVQSVLKRAIQAEENSCILYRSLEMIFKGEELEFPFSNLAEEEEAHKVLLENMLARM